MATWSVGSIADAVQNRYNEDIPTSISGAVLINIADMQRIFAQEYTGETIGSTTIAEKYQPALIDLTAANLLGIVETQGSNANSFTLGDLSVNKGGGSSSVVVADMLRESGMLKLRTIGRDIKFERVL